MRYLILILLFCAQNSIAAQKDCRHWLAKVGGQLEQTVGGQSAIQGIPLVSSSFPEQAYFQEANYFINFPDEIRPLMLQAITSKAKSAGSDTLSAANELMLMEPTPTEIETTLGREIDRHLSWGREHGLGQFRGAALLMNPSSASSNALRISGLSVLSREITRSELVERYELDQISKALTQFDVALEDPTTPGKPKGSSAYKVAYPGVMSAAFKVGLNDLAREAFLFAVRLGAYGGLTRSVRELGNSQALLSLGKLALTKYLFFDSNHSVLSDAIRALRSVNGPERAIASQLLVDLSDFLRTSEYKNAYGHVGNGDTSRQSLPDAMLSLQSSGEVVSKVRSFDGDGSAPVTKLKEPASKTRMRDLIVAVFQSDLYLRDFPFSLSAFAIGETPVLREIAISELDQLKSGQEDAERNWQMILRLALLSKDIELIEKVIEWPTRESVDVSFELAYRELILIDEESLIAADRFFETHYSADTTDDRPRRGSKQTYVASRASAMDYLVDDQQVALRLTQPDSHQKEMEERITEGLSLSLSERQTLSMQGYDLIRNGGKLWDAFQQSV
ncbi:MAG: hypothetical protein AAF202_02705 [Pseudomonadota bacterium]